MQIAPVQSVRFAQVIAQLIACNNIVAGAEHIIESNSQCSDCSTDALDPIAFELDLSCRALLERATQAK